MLRDKDIKTLSSIRIVGLARALRAKYKEAKVIIR